jgi:homoprotocatechuate degradation regulator HpaR
MAPHTPRVRLRAISPSLPVALLLSYEAVIRHFRPALRAFDITEQQWRVLRALSSISESDVGHLARATHLAPTSLSRILKDLHERRLIERQRSNTDMRLALVMISRDGLRLVDEFWPFAEGIYAQIASRYGGSRIAKLMVLLRQLNAELEGGASIGLDESPLKRNDGRRTEGLADGASIGDAAEKPRIFDNGS